MENLRTVLEQLRDSGGPDLLALLEQLQTILVIVGRPIVMQQIAAFIAALLVAWFASKLCWNVIKPHYQQRLEGYEGKERRRWEIRGGIIHFVLFPVLGMILVQLISWYFQVQNLRNELLGELVTIFWAILIYRVVVGLLYMIMDGDSMRRYHFRFNGPLFLVVMTGWSLSYILNINTLANIRLLSLFANPITLGALFAATVGFYFWMDGTWVGHDLARKLVFNRSNIDPGVIEAALTISRYVILGIGIAIVFNILGLKPESVALIGGGLSVGIGFGLREVLSNFISGILLLFEQSLRPGDIISVDGQIGIVQRLNIRSTIVRTPDNIEVIVPNQTFFTSSVTTYTKTDRQVRLLIPVGVSYSSDPDRIQELLLEIGAEHPLVAEDPPPKVFFMDFGASSIDFELGIWINDPTLIRAISSDIRFMIWKAFEINNIEIPFPQRDLHIRSTIESGVND